MSGWYGALYRNYYNVWWGFREGAEGVFVRGLLRGVGGATADFNATPASIPSANKPAAINADPTRTFIADDRD